MTPQLLCINKQGTRLFVTLNYRGAAGKVVMLDIARPDQPTLLSVVDLGLAKAHFDVPEP